MRSIFLLTLLALAGCFHPEETIDMERPSVHTITLGFVPARIWEKSLERYMATRNADLVYDHYFVDQHYPIDKRENSRANRAICESAGINVLDPGRNLGLHSGFNWALAQIKPAAGDVIIAYDPDMCPVTPGWDMALVRAIRGDPAKKVVWSSLMHTQVPSRDDLQVKQQRLADGYIELLVLKTPIMNSTCAWSYDWLKRVGGLTEPRAYYGHLESAMFARLNPNEQWAFLPGWADSHDLRLQHDPEYTEYKWVHSHHQTFDGDFESWLAAGKPRVR